MRSRQYPTGALLPEMKLGDIDHHTPNRHLYQFQYFGDSGLSAARHVTDTEKIILSTGIIKGQHPPEGCSGSPGNIPVLATPGVSSGSPG